MLYNNPYHNVGCGGNMMLSYLLTNQPVSFLVALQQLRNRVQQ